jgi:hypothetical protein
MEPTDGWYGSVLSKYYGLAISIGHPEAYVPLTASSDLRARRLRDRDVLLPLQREKSHGRGLRHSQFFTVS